MASSAVTLCFLSCLIAGVVAIDSIVDYPYFAAIENHGKHECSATIVDDFYVMTTNSCVGALPIKNMRVRVGTDKLGHRGAVFKVTYVYSYPNSNVSMVKLATGLPFGPRVMPVNPNNYKIEEGQPGVLLAWSNNKRQKSPLAPAPVVVIPSANCSAIYAGILDITSDMFCLAPSDADSHPCRAELGAPLYYNEQYYGLVTYSPGCTEDNLPVVVTAVAPYTSFIIAILCEFFFQ